LSRARAAPPSHSSGRPHYKRVHHNWSRKAQTLKPLATDDGILDPAFVPDDDDASTPASRRRKHHMPTPLSALLRSSKIFSSSSA
jgi:hypothetical protein